MLDRRISKIWEGVCAWDLKKSNRYFLFDEEIFVENFSEKLKTFFWITFNFVGNFLLQKGRGKWKNFELTSLTFCQFAFIFLKTLMSQNRTQHVLFVFHFAVKNLENQIENYTHIDIVFHIFLLQKYSTCKHVYKHNVSSNCTKYNYTKNVVIA